MAKNKKQPKTKKDGQWIEAKSKCRLNSDDIRIAKEMGLNPLSLIKNIPSKSQPWKSSVKDWLHEMYEKRQENAAKKKARKERATKTIPAVNDKPLTQKVAAYIDEDMAFEDTDDFPNSRYICQEDKLMLNRQEQFRIAAKYVADGLSSIPEVNKVVLFGSVAAPLEKEVPRFRKFRRAGIAVSHECKDVDMAVWVSDLTCLRVLQKVRSQALNKLLAEKQIGVAHHQVDIFIMEPKTNRYLGRLCIFGFCPKGKDRCCVDGCGKPMLLKQHEDFIFDATVLDDPANTFFFER
ncbi:MAG: hypothetical protein PHF37_01835 [Phycisphaerae bacterium]|nr:hypothetical protein [Phycisphaerae bacterium]